MFSVSKGSHRSGSPLYFDGSYSSSEGNVTEQMPRRSLFHGQLSDTPHCSGLWETKQKRYPARFVPQPT